MNLLQLANLSTEVLEPDKVTQLPDLIGPYMAVFFVAFATSFILTPTMRAIAVRFGIVDWPDHKRKAHIEPVAYLGGVAIFIGWLLGVTCLYFLGDVGPEKLVEAITAERAHMVFPMTVVLGAAVITATGLFDDVYGISPRVKIGGQLFAAAALAYNNVATDFIGDLFALANIQIYEGLAYALATAFIAMLVIGACNAVNLLDGLDGLAAGIGVIACIGFLFIASILGLRLVNGDVAINTDPIAIPIIIVICLATIGALMGFLPYNFNPANIFMGDAGSLLVGYLCAAVILYFAEVPEASKSMESRSPLWVMAALIVFGVPICDTALAIFRRTMRGQPIFSPDDQHIHHLLVRAGFRVKRSVFLMYAFGMICAIIGGSLVFLYGRFVLAVFVTLFAFIMATAYKSGHRKAFMARSARPDAPVVVHQNSPEPSPSTTDTPQAESTDDPVNPVHRDQIALER